MSGCTDITRNRIGSEEGNVRGWGIRPVVPGVLLMLLAAGCTVGPSARPAIVAAGDAPASSATAPDGVLPPLSRPGPSSITWTDCDADTRARLGNQAVPPNLRFQCAQLPGTLDSPDDPAPVPSHLSLLKVGQGVMPLVAVDDATGAPGTLYAAWLSTVLPSSLLQTFSLIGVDRRGTGASDGMHCVPPEARKQILGYDPDSDNLDDMLDSIRKATQQCTLDLDNALQSINSWRTADDLNRIRKALGVPRLNALGLGEGSRVLITFAARFPAQTGRLVLDGFPDPGADPQQRVQSKALAAERTFDAFAADCVAHGCPLGANPRQALAQLIDRLRRQSLTTDDGDTVTAGIAVNAVLTALPYRRDWRNLADALARAATGDGNGIAGLLTAQLTGSARDAARFDAGLATGCNDDPTRVPPQKVSASVKDLRTRQPLFGGVMAQSLLLCDAWPVPSQPVPAPNIHNAPPILMLSTANDLVTPEDGTKHTAQELSSAVLVSWQGSGHGALPDSVCATQTAQAFLVNGTVPRDGTACPP